MNNPIFLNGQNIWRDTVYHQRRYTDGKQTHEKMFNIIILFTEWLQFWSQAISSVYKDIEKLELSFTAVGGVKWYNHI